MIEYQIPHDTALELHILASMIYEPECIGDVVEIVKPRYFYHKSYEMFCESIFDMWKENSKNISAQALAPALEKSGISLTEMIDAARSVATVADIRYTAQRLKDIAALRAAVKVGAELVSNGWMREGDEIREAIGSAESKLSKITGANIQTGTLRSIKEILISYHENFEKLYNNPDTTGVTGMASGYPELDQMTAGFQNSDLIILAARPSVGKTALAMEMAKNMSTDSKESVAFFSLEMAAEPLAGRMLSSASRIDASKLRTGMIDESDWEKYAMGIGELSENNLMIDEQSGITVSEIKAKCRKIKRDRGLSAIFIDYLGLIKGDKNMSRYDLVSENTRELKNLAKEFNVPVICLCQLSRGVEQRQDKRPMMSDLRESGEIEQTADVIAFLYRDDYYDKESEKKNIIEVIISKQRNGKTGTVELAFLKNFNAFASLDRGQQVSVLPPKVNKGNVSKFGRR
jgi:replicative DNA helicase